MTIKQWIAIGVAAASAIAEIVLIFVNPVAAVFTGAGFILGGVTGYLAKKNNIVNSVK